MELKNSPFYYTDAPAPSCDLVYCQDTITTTPALSGEYGGERGQ